MWIPHIVHKNDKNEFKFVPFSQDLCRHILGKYTAFTQKACGLLYTCREKYLKGFQKAHGRGIEPERNVAEYAALKTGYVEPNEL